MTRRQFVAIVRKFRGWMEGDTARFPSVDLKDRCLKALALGGESLSCRAKG